MGNAKKTTTMQRSGGGLRSRLTVIGTVMVTLVGMGLPASADWTETKLTASDAASFDQYGFSVAAAGDRIVVGTLFGDHSALANPGSVYVYEPDGAGGWTETKLIASDAARNDRYGWSVAAAGDRIVVGAPVDDHSGLSGAGSAYVYESDGAGGWTETKLTASDAAQIARYGWSVAAAGDRIVVGAPVDDQSGSVYVYEPDGAGGWTETKLTASDAASFDQYGFSVAAAGDRIVVGRPFDDHSGLADVGSTYVYEPDGAGGWTETKLTASDAASADAYGRSVAAAADRIVVGAPFEDANNTLDTGSVYVYESDGTGGWTETKLTANEPVAIDNYGHSVAAAADWIVVGAPNGETGDTVFFNSGEAYVYEPDGAGGWDETNLTAADAAGGDRYGWSVAAAGDRIVVGAHLDNHNSLFNAGSAYVYEFTVTTVQIDIDVLPGSDDNPINLNRTDGVLPVALLGSADVDVTTVDWASVHLGDGATVVHNLSDPAEYADHLVDADADGLIDLVLHFAIADTGIAAGDTEVCVTGSLTDGTSIEGCDTITVLGG